MSGRERQNEKEASVRYTPEFAATVVEWAQHSTRLCAVYRDRQDRRCCAVGYVGMLSARQLVLQNGGEVTVIALDRLDSITPTGRRADAAKVQS